MTIPYGPLLDAVRGVRWPARRAVAAGLPGVHRSRQRGSSGEFTEYRLYRQGDDPKQLDWKLLARSDRAFIRLTDDRALLPTWIVVDASASLAFPDPESSAHPSKWSLAKALAVALATVVHSAADPVGLLVASGAGVGQLTPRTRRGTVREIARALDETRCVGTAALPTPLAPLLAPLSSNVRVVLISDWLCDLDETLHAAARLAAAGGQVECVHIVAAEEIDLPGGTFLARDPDDPARVPRPLHRAVRDEYRETFQAFRRDTGRRWRAIGAGFVEARTDVAPSRLVRHIVSGAGAEGAGDEVSTEARRA